MCGGVVHHVAFPKRGPIHFLDHPNIRDEIVANQMGADCPCARLLIAARAERIPEWWSIASDIASVLDAFRQHRSAIQRERQKRLFLDDPLETFQGLPTPTGRKISPARRLQATRVIALHKLRQADWSSGVFLRVEGQYADTMDPRRGVTIHRDWVTQIYRRGISLVDGLHDEQGRVQRYFAVQNFDTAAPPTVQILHTDHDGHIILRTVCIERYAGGWRVGLESRGWLAGNEKAARRHLARKKEEDAKKAQAA
jgi:hypothetical protein